MPKKRKARDARKLAARVSAKQAKQARMKNPAVDWETKKAKKRSNNPDANTTTSVYTERPWWDR